MLGEDFAKRRLGETIDGRYELKRLVGVGMTGAVYEASHQYTERSVAVKVMHQQLLTNEEAVARFLREAKSVAKIGHPAIVEVIDAGETADRWPYVVLELLTGRSMGDAINQALPKSAFSPNELAAIGLDLLGGLSAAHSVGIVHRDLKPDNVFLLADHSGGSCLKILDFGVAKNLQSSGASAVLTKPGATIGTPSYMSPEQARASAIDQRTDIWSAGALLFHAAAGRPPHDEVNIPALLMKLVTTRPPSLGEVVPDAPPSLITAVDGALDPDLDARWQSAAAMAEALRGG